MSTSNTQTVGQSLTLLCKISTVRGVTSGVNILWRIDGKVSREINFTTAIMLNNSQVYTDSYTITQLSTTDNGKVYQCIAVITSSTLLMANDSVTLDVIGM